MSADEACGAAPTPGSAEAKARGYSCPVTEDSVGDGYVVRERGAKKVVTYWWQDDACPLHGFGTGYKWAGKRPGSVEGQCPEFIEGGRRD